MLGLQVTYGALALFARASLLQGLSPRVFVVYRQATATLFISPVDFLWRVAVSQTIYYEGMYLASSSTASATNNLVPAITFFMASALGMEKVNVRSLRSIAKILGTAVCVCGAIVMALLRGPKLLNAEFHLLASSIFAPEGNVWWVPMSASHPDHLSLSAWMCFISTIQCTVITFLLEQDPAAWKLHSRLGIAAILFAIITILAAIFLHEEIYTGSLAGGIGAVAGLYIVLWGKAEDLVEINEETEPKLQIDCAHTVKPSVDRPSMEKLSSCKSDLSEPLLSDISADETNPV
ncbi:hypothetical protein BT93_C0167 [Corymbia citriodora subsp. variegata]|nr:hypothetical protein BT93_C0167 [Corymbia citriodora subsp. variegata]